MADGDARIEVNLSEDAVWLTLNRIVCLYFAKLQAWSHTLMYMKDWIEKLDDFMKLFGCELLPHAGKIFAEVTREKANLNTISSDDQLSSVEIHFLENFELESRKLGETKLFS